MSRKDGTSVGVGEVCACIESRDHRDKYEPDSQFGGSGKISFEISAVLIDLLFYQDLIHEAMERNLHSLATNEFSDPFPKRAMSPIPNFPLCGKGGYANTKDAEIPCSFLRETPRY